MHGTPDGQGKDFPGSAWMSGHSKCMYIFNAKVYIQYIYIYYIYINQLL